MKATDKVTLELTGRQLAKIYAVMGRSNGPLQSSVWEQVSDILDPDRTLYATGKERFFPSRSDVLDYNKYYAAWEALVLEAEKTQQQLQLEALEKTIQDAQQQIAEIKKNM